MKQLISFLFIFIIFLSSFSATYAQENLNLTASPSSFDLSMQTGTSRNEILRIHNNNDSALPIVISLKKIIPDTNGSLILEDFQPTDDYKNFITFDTTTVTAQPHEWTIIPFQIKIPQNAAFSYYWAIAIQTGTNTTEAIKPGTKLTAAVAIPVLLRVERNGTIFNADFTDFRASSLFSEYLPTTFLSTIMNKSNVHIKPIGNIFIKDWFGNQIAVIPINKEAGNILPSAKRTFTSAWDDSFITEEPVIINGKTTIHTVFHFDKLLNLRMGKYTATALVVVSGDKKDLSYTLTTTFWVFPWKIIIGLFIVIFLAGVGLISTAKSLGQTVKKLLKK